MMESKQVSSTRTGLQNGHSGWGGWPQEVTILATNRDTVAVLPAGYPLRRSSFTRRGGHLIVQASNYPEIAIPRFFSGGCQTALATEDGVEVSRNMLLFMSNLS